MYAYTPDEPGPAAGGKESKQKKIRVFIAVNLPDHVTCWLSGIQKELKAFGLSVHWTRPENVHLTLKFLGEIIPQNVVSVCHAVEESAEDIAPVEIFAKGVGVFPGVKRPRVLWTGIAGRIDQLCDLQRNIDTALNGLGFPKDERAFTGHLTIGRFGADHRPHSRSPESLPELLIDTMKRFHQTASLPFLADAVHVLKSDLTPAGPIYTNLATVQLRGA